VEFEIPKSEAPACAKPLRRRQAKSETIPNDPNSNDQNGGLLGSCFEHWSIGILSLFHASDFDIRIS
jgi:hypothetical protein